MLVFGKFYYENSEKLSFHLFGLPVLSVSNGFISTFFFFRGANINSL